jgi:phage gp29-like protein
LPEFAAPANKTDDTDGQTEIDALVDSLSKNEKLQSQMETLLKPFLNLIENADSFDDITDGINKLYPKMNEIDIQKTIEKAMLISEIWGRLKI